jgi:undecaprenyl-diphosphatase
MLLNELVKILVHRQRPFVDGPFVDWAGYSFASGHTIGATLLWGQLLLFALPLIRSRRVRRGLICVAVVIVLLVGFSRIALGAHYFTDVVAAMLFGSGWLALCSTTTRSFRRRRTPLAVEIVSELAPVPVAVEAIPNE